MAITPTTITNESQIYLAGSPINIRLKNLAQSTAIKSVVMELYVWSGNLNAPPTLASYTFVSDKVSANDNYINFQIAEVVASHINGTKFAWASGDAAPSIAGEGVFFHIKYQVTNASNVEAAVELPTGFATMGYRYDFEQRGDIVGGIGQQPYLGLIPVDYSNRKYTCGVKYWQRTFNFGLSTSVCTSENIIVASPISPPTIPQRGDKYLVVYINRLGLWDYFTPFGKAIKSIKIDSTTNPRLYRNPNSINNNVNHSKQRGIDQTPQSYVLNTGELHESMTDQVEEVIYSPMCYLIEFTGETYTVANLGLTVDSTLVTVDSTTYTVDEDVITNLYFGYYSTFKQIPVTCETNAFIKKSRLNDKGKINYDLNFDATVGRINDLR